MTLPVSVGVEDHPRGEVQVAAGEEAPQDHPDLRPGLLRELLGEVPARHAALRRRQQRQVARLVEEVSGVEPALGIVDHAAVPEDDARKEGARLQGLGAHVDAQGADEVDDDGEGRPLFLGDVAHGGQCSVPRQCGCTVRAPPSL